MTRSVSLLRCWPLLLVALGGCGSAPPVGSPPPSPQAAASAAPASAASSQPTLLDEQRRLDALFRGTPVVFTMQSSGSLRVDVPLQFCFETGQAVVKPALAAVVDRLAQSQHDTVRRIAVSAAGDRPARPAAAASAARRGAAATALGNRRAAAVRDRLVAQGIAAERITLVDGDAAAAGVSVVVRDPALP